MECARIAACEVRVPSSQAIASTASRSSWTVNAGVRSRATRITGASGRACSSAGSSTPIRCVRTRISTSVRSASRSRSIALPVVVHRPRHSSILSWNARSAEKWFSRIRRSVPVLRSWSSRIMSCASKIRASSSPARSAAFTRLRAIRSRAKAIASVRRAVWAATWSGPIGTSGTTGASQRTTSAGPTATPGETAIPLITRCGISPPRSPRPPAPAARPPPARRRPRRRGSPVRSRTPPPASSCP